jgi:hypothetical protein
LACIANEYPSINSFLISRYGRKLDASSGEICERGFSKMLALKGSVYRADMKGCPIYTFYQAISSKYFLLTASSRSKFAPMDLHLPSQLCKVLNS